MELVDLFKKYHLEQYSEKIQNLAQDAIRISTIPANNENLPIVASKFGGSPDLPDSISWPKWKGTPLSFLGQINLSEISTCDNSKYIGEKGLLLFFYDSEQRTWGFDPKDMGSWRVIYCENTQKCSRRELPRKMNLPFLSKLFSTKQVASYKECRLQFHSVSTLPPWESRYIDKLGLSKDEVFQYGDLVAEFQNTSSAPNNQILGHPSPVQGEMQLECQLASNGIYIGDPSGYKHPLREELESGADDWQLLMQIDSDDNAGMMWGDVGMLYFWIRKTDLANRNFDKTWMILQCC